MKKSCSNISGWKNEKGYTLIEVMIGMAILSIGLLAIAMLQTSAVRNNKTGNTFTQASALACTQLEWLKNQRIDDLSLGSGSKTGLNEKGEAGGIYNLSWTIAAYSADTNNDGTADMPTNFARTATVTVSFPFVGSGTRTVTLSSVIAGGGL